MPSDETPGGRSVSPDDIIAGHSAQVRELAARLRRLILDAVPDAVEAGYGGWHGIGYRHPEQGYLCAIFPREDSVRMGFEYGVLLPDPAGVLEGAGKQVRYVTVRAGDDVPESPIRSLLKAATGLPPERAVKLSLIRNTRGSP